MPLRTVLAQNYPNPFNPKTQITYQLSKSVESKIQIYDARGKIVHTLDLRIKPTGIYFNQTHAAYGDGTNTAGEQVANGIYFYTFRLVHFLRRRNWLLLGKGRDLLSLQLTIRITQLLRPHQSLTGYGIQQGKQENFRIQ